MPKLSEIAKITLSHKAAKSKSWKPFNALSKALAAQTAKSDMKKSGEKKGIIKKLFS